MKSMKQLTLFAVLSGILLALSWPTYGLSFLIFLAFVPLLWLERSIRTGHRQRKGVKVWLLSYFAFIIWNAITTGWLYYADLFGVLFAVLVNALLMSIVFLIYHKVATRVPEKMSIVFLPVFWIAFEKFHLNWDFSWPWLNLGNVFSESHLWIQWYEYTGVFGGSLWIWLVNIGIFRALVLYKSDSNRKQLYYSLVKPLLLIAFPVIISLFIYKNYQEKGRAVSGIVLQPNVDPYTEKYNMANTEVANQLLALAEPEIQPDTRFIFAPETVFAEGFGERLSGFKTSPLYLQLKNYTQKHPQINLVMGIQFFNTYHEKGLITQYSNKVNDSLWYDTYNSAFHINNTDKLDVYHKSKLVVGIETFPFKSILEPLLGNIMIDLGGTVSMRAKQKERGVFSSEDRTYSVAPIICYESVYGEYVTGYVRNGANFLSILTNDGWWRKTQGHKQHLSYARLRAIETRRDIARSANTGISAFINQRGDIVKLLPYDTKGALSGTIHTNEALTFYTRFGDYIARLSMFVAGLIFLFSLAKKKQKL